MYNFSGIWYKLIIRAASILVGIGIIIKSEIFNKRARKKFKITSRQNKLRMIGYVLIGLLFSLAALQSTVKSVYALNDPKIESFDGYYKQTPRAGTHAFEHNGKTIDLYLNVFFKRKIYPKAFEKDTLYKVFYEARTKVIVRIEALETGD